MLACVGTCEWDVVAPKKHREKRRKKDLRRKCTTVGGNLHLLFTLQSESCLLCPRLGPYSLYGDEDTESQRKHFSFSISHPPFILPLPPSHKGWDHYGRHVDRWELSITLLRLRFVGSAATQFIALQKCGWAKQAAELVQLIGGKDHRGKQMQM